MDAHKIATGTRQKVLYISGFERSGSTLFHNVLGQLDGYLATGEPRYIWDNGLLGSAYCGCGRLVKECPQWQAILAIVAQTVGALDPAKLVQLRHRSRWLTPLLFVPGGKTLVQQLMSPYLETTSAFYRAIAEVTGCRIIIDSSKSPLYSLMLSLIDDIDLYIIHLVRDPRGVEYSLLKRKEGNHPNYHRHNVLRGATSWMIWNGAIEQLWAKVVNRYYRVRYEDFVIDPKTILDEVIAFAGEGHEAMTFVDGNQVHLKATCSIGGSPSRFHTGWITMEADVDWRESLDPSIRSWLEKLTSPFLYRYGYTTIIQEGTNSLSE